MWCLGAGLVSAVPKLEDTWSLRPLPPAAMNPKAAGSARSLIDSSLAAAQEKLSARPLEPADALTWLRRVSLDLVGLPPTVEEQDALLADSRPDARERVVDRLLASEQHGVRYGRHWLDVLRYTDFDENMPATPGIHYWRDWVVNALNQDLPYDQFVRAQVLGNRAPQRRIISAAGHLTPVDPRPEDFFALGFLARGATSPGDDDQQLAIAAVETIGSAFMGFTVGCARCHNHFFDPIRQSEYYSMKSLFDPLVLRPVTLATPEQIFEHGRQVEEHERRLAQAVAKMRVFIKPHHDRLYEERLSSFPPDVQAAIRKPENARNAAEQKTYDDYYPILRIDPPKIKQVMTAEEVETYDGLLKAIEALKPPESLPVFWTVAEDPQRASQTNYVLNTGDPKRPMKDRPVSSGFPFAPASLEFRSGRRETFVDWLTAPANPLFARVVVNRIWGWHFGTGLHPSPNDFGALGGTPTHPELLDALAAAFVEHGFSMKWLHKEMVLSATYGRASRGAPEWVEANQRVDPENRTLWRFPLRRLEAEPLRDTLLAVSGKLDRRLGGRSFDGEKTDDDSRRRAAYMARGYRTYQDVMPDFLQVFDAEDGRAVCPRRNQTVTAPQALYLMNHEFTERAAEWFAAPWPRGSSEDWAQAIRTGYRSALGRPPTGPEERRALVYLDGQADRLKGFAWLLFNLDEFLYVR